MSQKVTPLSAEQITQLAAMQDHLNQLTCQSNFGHPDWRSMGFNWGLAIVDEVMEIHGHLGWKWWKGSDKYQVGVTSENKKQIQLEVIDILHFGLSKSMQCDQELGCTHYVEDMNINYNLKWMMIGSLELNEFSWMDFTALCSTVDLDSTQIMETYIGKYALNIFRQDNGYGDGTYQKFWNTTLDGPALEDNQWLEKVILDIQMSGLEVTVEEVTSGLTYWYGERI